MTARRLEERAMYGCWTDERAVRIANDFLAALGKLSDSEIIAALEKAKEDSQDSYLLDGEESAQ